MLLAFALEEGLDRCQNDFFRFVSVGNGCGFQEGENFGGNMDVGWSHTDNLNNQVGHRVTYTHEIVLPLKSMALASTPCAKKT